MPPANAPISHFSVGPHLSTQELKKKYMTELMAYPFAFQPSMGLFYVLSRLSAPASSGRAAATSDKERIISNSHQLDGDTLPHPTD